MFTVQSFPSLRTAVTCSTLYCPCPCRFNLYRLSVSFEVLGIPDSSVGKGSTGNAGDPGLIPGSGRSAGEGIGYPLQFSWASLVAQTVKNPPAMWEAWI